jgi:hypothetical protein
VLTRWLATWIRVAALVASIRDWVKPPAMEIPSPLGGEPLAGQKTTTSLLLDRINNTRNSSSSCRLRLEADLCFARLLLWYPIVPSLSASASTVPAWRKEVGV